MSDVKTIDIYTKPSSTWRIMLRHIVIWCYLVGAEAVSHIWFGGSWVIDSMVLIGLVALVSGGIMREAGMRVEMTTAEIRLWVAAGMPLDIKQWRVDRKRHEAA